VQPPSARTVLAAGSTRTPFMPERSITSPSSQIPNPPPLWPPPRTATSSLLSRAWFTQAMTSATSAHFTISAGRLSIIPL